MPGTYLRGALVELVPTALIPIPNIIIFQYNPETMTHTWTQPEAPKQGTAQSAGNPLAVGGTPGEAFSFTLAMDAADTIADGLATAPLAAASGIYTRLAALELLLYPSQAAGGGLLGTVTAGIASALGASSSAASSTVPILTMPTVLFVWGPGRILPVRVTSLTITEKLYDPLLNPTHAEAQVGLRVLTPDELAHDTDTLAAVANAAYTYSMDLRQALAIANLANSVESAIGMLPF